MNHFSFLAYSPQVKHMTWGGGVCVMLDLSWHSCKGSQKSVTCYLLSAYICLQYTASNSCNVYLININFDYRPL